MSGSDLFKKDQQYIWHPFTPLTGAPDPLVVTSGEGIYLHTEDGKKIIDGISSWWVNIHGHSHPHIAEAVARQASTLEHVIFAGFTHEPAIKLAENLLSILPDNISRIFFSDNGSTAVEVGLKMAFQYWHNKGEEKHKVIAIDGAYHGDTFGSMSVGERGPFTAPFSPYLFEVDFVDFPRPEFAEEVLEVFGKLLETGKVGAFIYEPLVQGASGMRMYDKEVLKRMLEMAREHEVICIADEVFTGFGRTGKLFASDYLDIKPDIMALSKGLTGGSMALSVTACSRRIEQGFEDPDLMKTFFHGHSFTANPIACAASNASFDLLMTKDCVERINTISIRHEQFRERISAHKLVKEARSLGTILALELDTGSDSGYFNEMRQKIYPFFMERDILLRPLGNVIYFLPPYVIREEELVRVYSAIEEFLDANK